MKQWLRSAITGTLLVVMFLVPFFVSAQSVLIGGLAGAAGSALAGNVVSASDSPFSICGNFEFGCQLGMFVMYGIWYRITNMVAQLSGYLADYFLWVSVQSSLYRFGEIITIGWKIVRDVVNIGFIAALLWAGISYIMGRSGGSRILIKIILSALLINFSLFGAKMVIDAGNITARAIYAQIAIGDVELADNYSLQNGAFAEAGTTTQSEDGGKANISLRLLSSINPQRFILQQPVEAGADTFWKLMASFFFAGFLNILLIAIFVSMAMLFITRTVSLVFLTIIVPIPIVVDLIPEFKKQVSKLSTGSLMSFEVFLPEFLKLSFMAPIYVFFIYIILKVNESLSKIGGLALSPNANLGEGIVQNTFQVILPLLLTYIMIRWAAKISKDFAGTFGQMVNGALSSAVGFVGSLALGGIAKGASLAGGAVGKGLQARVAAGMTPEQRAAKLAEDIKGKGFFERKMLRAKYGMDSAVAERQAKLGNYLTREATYDARNIPKTGAFKAFAGSKVGGMFMKEATAIGPNIDFGKAETRSYNERDMQRLKEAEERRKLRTQTIHTAMDDHHAREVKRIEAERKTRAADPEKQAELERERNEVLNGVNTGPVREMDVKAQDNKVKSVEKEVKKLEEQRDLATDQRTKRDLDRKIVEKRIEAGKEKEKLEKMQFNRNNYAEHSVETLRQSLTDDEEGRAATATRPAVRSIKWDEYDVKEEEKKLKEVRDKLARDKRELAILKSQADRAKAKKEGDRTPDDKEAMRKYNEKAADIVRRENNEKPEDDKGDSVLILEKNLDKKKKALEERQKRYEKAKKAIDEREKKAKEIEESVVNKSYLDNDPEAKAYTDYQKELRQKYIAEKDPAKKDQRLADIHDFGGQVQKIRAERNAANPNNAFEFAYQKNMLDQHDLNKQVASHLIATDMIRDMQNAYSNMARMIVAGVAGTAVAAAGAAGAAAIGAIGTPAMIAALITGGVAGSKLNDIIGTTQAPGLPHDRQSTLVGKAIDGMTSGVNNFQAFVDNTSSWFNRSASNADIEKAFRDSMK